MKEYKQISLKEFSTFKTNSKAENLLILENEKDFESKEVRNAILKPYYILGGGSNTLFVNKFPGTVIVIKNKGIKILDENDKRTLVKVAAGENWNNFVQWSVKHNLIGIQNLIDIPGTVGASPVQNIGAYNTEVQDYIKDLTIFNLSSFTTESMNNRECRFGYRDSIFKNKLKNKVIIKDVTFELKKYTGNIDKKFIEYKGIEERLEGKEITLQSLMEVIKIIREEKLPPLSTYGTCGSTFENFNVLINEYEDLLKKFPGLPKYDTDMPNVYKIPTAYILEKLGWKNKREGRVGTWEKHPLIVVNYNNAKGSDIYKFILKMQKDFKLNTGIDLIPEINIIVNRSGKFNS